jgi:hypothetical protein
MGLLMAQFHRDSVSPHRSNNNGKYEVGNGVYANAVEITVTEKFIKFQDIFSLHTLLQLHSSLGGCLLSLL